MVVWGRGQWTGAQQWSLADLGGEARAAVEGLDIEAIESLAAGVCPVCGSALVWGEALPVGLLAMVDKQPLGAGYYRLADIRPPPAQDKFRPRYSLLGYLLNVKHYKLELAGKRAEGEALREAQEQQGWWSGLLNSN